MIKIISLFLVVILLLAMFGRLRIPGVTKAQGAKCPECGRYRIGSGPCACKKKG